MDTIPDQTEEGAASSEPPQAVLVAPNFALWISLSLLASLIFCGGWFFSLAGLVSVLSARSDWKSGHRVKAMGKLRTAKILCLAGAVIGALIVGLFLAFQGVGGGSLPPMSY